MASDNLLAEQLWPFRTVFSDPWISDLFTREADALTEALQHSFAADSTYAGFFPVEPVGNLPVRTPSGSGGSESEADPISKRRRGRATLSDAWISDHSTREADTRTGALQQSFANDSSYGGFFPVVEQVFGKLPVQTASGSGGSESEAVPVSKRRRGVPPRGRIAKRKPRESKRGTTTFIAADPENFRRMVQEVTGGNLGGLTLLQPAAHRTVGQLDASSLFLDGFAPTSVAQPHPSPAGGGAAKLDLNSSSIFPTLESWDVVPLRGFS